MRASRSTCFASSANASSKASDASSVINGGTRVGGVPLYTVDAPGPRRAVLAFRVGRADETLAWAGLTHLVEHLALLPFKEQPYSYGGQVEGARTLFYAHGTDAEIREFFERLCENLRTLPLDHLADEARLLETEAQSRTGGALSSLLGGRYGCQGWGLVDFPEYALLHPDAERVKAWANEWFTAGNAVLGLSGSMDPPPPIALLPGRRMPSPTFASVVRTPAWMHAGKTGVGMSLTGPYSIRFSALIRVVERHGRSRLRFRESLSYEVGGGQQRLGSDVTHGILWADGLPENLSKVMNGMLAVLDEVMEKGPTEEEIREDLNALRKSIDNPGWLMSLLDSQLTHELFGTTMPTVDEAVADLEKATPADYSALLQAIFPSLLTVVPPGVAVLDQRLTAVPAWSTTEAKGKTYRLRAAATVVSQQMTSLSVGNAAISLRLGPGNLVTIPYAECVAALAWDDGSRTLLSRDGFRLHVRPDDWKDGAEIAEALREALPKDVLVPAGPRPNPDPDVLSGDRPPEAKAKRRRVDWSRAVVTLVTGLVMLAIYLTLKALTAGH
jgi:zinc protease